MTANKKVVPHFFFQCPNCGYMSPSLTGYGEKPVFECFKCKKRFRMEEYRIVERKVTAYKCPKCGEYVADVSENWNILGVFKEVLCPKCKMCGCGSVFHELVAMGGLHVSKIGKVHPKMLKRGLQTSDGLYVLQVKTKRDKMALRYLNIMAKVEDSSFTNMPRKGWNYYMLFSKRKLLGYLAWTCGCPPVLRQLFIVEDERRKGYATSLVKHFVDTQCSTFENILFHVESPNEASLGLLEKLGYVKVENDEAVGVRVLFIRG